MSKGPSWELYGTFLEVMRGGSLSAASRALRVAQPTVRRRIEQLEAEPEGSEGRTIATALRDLSFRSAEDLRWSCLFARFRNLIEPNRFDRFAGLSIAAPNLDGLKHLDDLKQELTVIDDITVKDTVGQHLEEQLAKADRAAIAAFLARHSAEHFRRAYALRTEEERLVLRGLAENKWVRTDTRAIRALIDSGLVRLNPWPELASEGWRAFLLNEESDESLRRIQSRLPRDPGAAIGSTVMPLLAAAIVALLLLNTEQAEAVIALASAGSAIATRLLGRAGQAARG
ncbi:MAG: LysR family transcriptional regulator [Sphingomonadaceae bacterium]